MGKQDFLFGYDFGKKCGDARALFTDVITKARKEGRQVDKFLTAVRKEEKEINSLLASIDPVQHFGELRERADRLIDFMKEFDASGRHTSIEGTTMPTHEEKREMLQLLTAAERLDQDQYNQLVREIILGTTTDPTPTPDTTPVQTETAPIEEKSNRLLQQAVVEAARTQTQEQTQPASAIKRRKRLPRLIPAEGVNREDYFLATEIAKQHGINSNTFGRELTRLHSFIYGEKPSYFLSLAGNIIPKEQRKSHNGAGFLYPNVLKEQAHELAKRMKANAEARASEQKEQ